MAPKRRRQTLAGPEDSPQTANQPPPPAKDDEGSQPDQPAGQKSFEEMREMYPLLARKLELIAEEQQNPAFKSAFVRLDARRARSYEDQLESIREEELRLRVEGEATRAVLVEEIEKIDKFDKDMERCKVRHGYLSFHNLHRQQVMAKKSGHGTLKDA